jgi:hypothetical protein
MHWKFASEKRNRISALVLNRGRSRTNLFWKILGGVGLDLMLAFLAPDDQPDVGGGIAEASSVGRARRGLTFS